MKKVDKKLASDSFINFVHSKNENDVAKWEQWIKENPQYQEHIERTRLVVESMVFNHQEVNEELVELQWQELQNKISRNRFSKPQNRPNKRLMFGVAGMVLVFGICLIIWFKVFYNPMVTFETQYAERAKVSLPDGSEVTLNKNSSIKFYKNWQEGKDRNVWLDGEGYFKVQTQKNKNGQSSKFTVETEEILIEVLGTEFSVNTKDQSRLVLEYGKVNVQKKGNSKVFKMEPGQSALINEQGELVMENEKLLPHISWADGKIFLRNNSLGEIIEFLESSYDLHIQCDDLYLLERKLSGRLRVDNIDDLLQVIEKVLGLVVVKQDNAIKIFEIKNL